MPRPNRDRLVAWAWDFCTELLKVRYVEWNGLSANASPLLSLTLAA